MTIALSFTCVQKIESRIARGTNADFANMALTAKTGMSGDLCARIILRDFVCAAGIVLVHTRTLNLWMRPERRNLPTIAHCAALLDTLPRLVRDSLYYNPQRNDW